MKRTHLPLNALRVFDAAARHLSFTRAADELAVTPAAVGQQIRALEDHLGIVLFRRTSRGLELTVEGAAGLDPLREGFLRFEESVAAMQAGQARDAYTIACPRTFYAAWLAPRLATFLAAMPETRFTLVEDEGADFAEVNLDCAIRLADGPGELQGVELVAAGRVTVARPAALGGAADRAIVWSAAFAGDEADSTIAVANVDQALASVQAGMGRAVVPHLLVAADIAAGRLDVLAGPSPTKRAFWLMAPLPQWRTAKVRSLVAHLTTAPTTA